MSDETSGTASTIALTVGMMGMLGGGWLTDILTRRFGPRRGRMIPLAWGRLIGAAAYLSCLIPGVPAWACVAAFATVAVMTDLGVPATWSYCQDVGGRNVAAVLAWPNMWGNVGAAVMPTLLTWINAKYDANHDWHESLVVTAAAFLASGLVAFGVHADKKIEGTGAEEPESRGFAVVPIPSQPPVDRTVN
jgi:MFS family permease